MLISFIFISLILIRLLDSHYFFTNHTKITSIIMKQHYKMIDSIQNKWHQQLREHGNFKCFIDNNHKNYEKSNIINSSYAEMIRNFWINRYDWDYFLSSIQKEYLLKNPEYFGIAKIKITSENFYNQVNYNSVLDKKMQSKSLLNGNACISLSGDCENISFTNQSLLTNPYSIQDYYKQTETLLKENLFKSINFLGNDHFNTISISIKLANLHFNYNKYEKAEKLYKEILKLIRLKYGNNHSDLQIIKRNLSIIFKQQGKILKAAALNFIMKEAI